MTGRFEANWASLDKRQRPAWFDEGKFGIFIHWGVYSVPAVGDEWFWYNWRGPSPQPHIEQFVRDNYKPGFSYADFAPLFTAEFFDADKLADLVKKSGAKYAVLTSKHHDGFALWPSKNSWNWNSVDTGPHRDLISEIKTAISKVGGVKFGLFYSHYEWFNPLYLADKASDYKTNDYVRTVSQPHLHDLVRTYKPDILWSDGDWDAESSYWQSESFLSWLYNDSAVGESVMVNDRWGRGAPGCHGDYYSYSDRFDPGHIMAHKWECCMTIDRLSWGFRRTMSAADVLPIQTLIRKLARTVSCGGNLLLNVGPTHDGRIVPIFEERLDQIGRWLGVNGEAIYATKPWIYQREQDSADVWYTSRMRDGAATTPEAAAFNKQETEATIVYAILLDWPRSQSVTLKCPKPIEKTTVTMLGYDGPVEFSIGTNGELIVSLAAVNWRSLQSEWAWVLKIERLDDEVRDPIEEVRRAGTFEHVDKKMTATDWSVYSTGKD